MNDIVSTVWQKLTEQIEGMDARFTRDLVHTEQANIGQGVRAFTFANLPATPAGTQTDGTSLVWVSNGRKAGEGAGLGTGVLAIYDPVSTNWLRTTDYSVVVI